VSRIFLDTSAYSAFKRGHPQIQHRVREASEIRLNPVVLGELRAGFLKGTRLAENLAGLTEFLASPRVELVLVDEETAERYALILDSLRRAGTPIPINDVWIAASAMQHGSVLLTTDPHFREVAQIVAEVLEPYVGKPSA
jgi:tRNA(fMet)-specific endonuclease VapC